MTDWGQTTAASQLSLPAGVSTPTGPGLGVAGVREPHSGLLNQSCAVNQPKVSEWGARDPAFMIIYLSKSAHFQWEQLRLAEEGEGRAENVPFETDLQ